MKTHSTDGVSAPPAQLADPMDASLQQRAATDGRRLYIGWRSRVVRPDLLATPRSPNGSKNPDANDCRVEAGCRHRQDRPDYIPGVAGLEHVVAFDGSGSGPVFEEQDEREGCVAFAFYEFIARKWASPQERPSPEAGQWIACMFSVSFGRILAYEVMALGDQSGLFAALPPWRLIRGDAVGSLLFDPVNVLLPAGVRSQLGVNSALRLWFKGRTPAVPATPAEEALICYRLCQLSGL